MPYASTSELPPAVRQKLKPKRQRQWMHVWNSEYADHGDESRAFASAWSTTQKRLGKAADYEGTGIMSDFNFFLPISKVEKQKDGSAIVSGYASTPTLDMDGEIVSLDAVKKALPGYWAWRNIREMHQPSAVGVAKEANVDGKGLFLMARISDKDAAQKCIDEVYKGFSVGGRKLAKNGNVITDIELVEVSVVDRPANPDCKFDVHKAAGAISGGTLVKVAKPIRDPKDRALGQVAKAVRTLAKVRNPPASHDGFSLPAKTAAVAQPILCKKHGKENCAKCAMKMSKRDVKAGERQSLASQGNALPDGSFPIKNRGDLANARQAIGRSKNPGAARSLIRRRAKELGVDLPDNWSKKLAKRLIANAEQHYAELAKKASAKYDLTKSAEPSFLTLTPTADGGKGAADKGTSAMRRGDEVQTLVPRIDGTSLTKSQRRALIQKLTSTEDIAMTMKKAAEPNLDEIINALTKRGAAPSRQQRMMMARGNLKKARKSMKECSVAIKAAHGMHKAAYLSKMEKRGKSADDGEFDHQGAMEKLQKAYQSLEAMKTFVKAANINMKKAASRVGQRGQETSDADSDAHYEVPRGLTDMSQDQISRAGPGKAGESGSEPPILDMIREFPGKGASITPREAALMVRAATAEAEANVLSKLPAGPVHGKRPAAFDTSSLFGEGSARATDSIMKGVNPNGLVSDDEEIRKAAVGRVIGNMVLGGHGKSIFDPNFHGTAGATRQ